MDSIPWDVYQAAPRRWTKHEVRAAYDRVKENPNRACLLGHIGGDIVVQLLQRGHSPD
jgi:hypothetical protein